jgi:hypothetical protein
MLHMLTSVQSANVNSIGLGIGFAKLAKGCTLPCGKKGLKAQRVKVAGKR